MNDRLIERLLTNNSSFVVDNVVTSKVVLVAPRSRFRPDKIYGATSIMKWAAIFGGVDSPYMLAKGKAVAIPEEAALKNELVELKEFKL